MFEHQYRQRLERDLARWQAEGLIAASCGEAIRAALGPASKRIDLPTSVAIVGGLLISAAFLAFVAANWSEIARPARFGILLAGIAASYGLGAVLARAGRTVLADLCAAVGCLVFGAAIALTGQMYHLGEDFTAGMGMWALGALLAAALTGSRGALAVALVVASVWHGAMVTEDSSPVQPYFIAFWLVAAALAIAWNAPSARHLTSAAAAVACGVIAIGIQSPVLINPVFVCASATAVVFGAGLLLHAVGWNQAARSFGLTLSVYGAFAFALALPMGIANVIGSRAMITPWPAIVCGAAGIAMSLAAAGLSRRLGPAFAALALTLGLATLGLYGRPVIAGEAWLNYALALAAMLALIVSGMSDDVQPRMVAGWIGLAALIAVITWSVSGSLLRRAMFLAVAGGATVALALALGRTRKARAAT
jgi:uncharacterized membrane protein